MMVAYAEDAVDYARERFGVTLDYSVDSVKHVEEIATKLYESIPTGISRFLRKGPKPTEVETICKMLGAYVGEVYRREKGGEWDTNEKFKAIGVRKGESWIFPPAKIHKRLTNGPEDNVWFYFGVLLAQHKDQKP